MKTYKDIDFLNSYWSEAKRIASDVEENLPKGLGEARKPIYSNGGAKMYIVSFSDLVDTWSPNDLIYNACGTSDRLKALADKISYMIYKGNANSVKPMVEAICNNSIKKLSQPYIGTSGDFLGYGHFRWNYQAYTLNDKEIEHLKKYFKL